MYANRFEFMPRYAQSAKSFERFGKVLVLWGYPAIVMGGLIRPVDQQKELDAGGVLG